ncbi:MAG TPA: sugar ABC transporter ATP-binding protein [Roseiarcus sp.]|jgi:ABC-type sugar transport system ATPase subunit
MTNPAPFVELRNVTKTFPGVVAARDVSISFFPGRVHALLGENGAGKSTLVKIVSGIYSPDGGQILFEGRPVRLRAPVDAEREGVAVVHQHRTLVDDLSVAENLFLGRLGRTTSTFRRSDWNERAKALLFTVGLNLDPSTPVRNLSPAAQQLLEIARAIGREARLVIFDEPTTSLTPPECEVLFSQIRRLRGDGYAIVYISHDLEQALAISDEITVLRDGSVVAHEPGLKDVDVVVRHMIGRTLADGYPRNRVPSDQEVLRVRGLRSSRLNGVDLAVRRGEIVCIAGLVGSGRTEFLRAIFGLDGVDGGEILLKGKAFTPISPRRCINAGLGFVSEDRKQQGLVLDLGVSANVVLGAERPLARLGLMSSSRERSLVSRVIGSLRIKAADASVSVGTLSGGNQQKVVLGRWLSRSTDLLLIDEPTIGIDVGARAEFYRLLDDYAAAGGACLIVSSDLNEVLGLADRVFVMRNGASVAQIEREDMNRETLLRAMTAVAA